MESGSLKLRGWSGAPGLFPIQLDVCVSAQSSRNRQNPIYNSTCSNCQDPLLLERDWEVILLWRQLWQALSSSPVGFLCGKSGATRETKMKVETVVHRRHLNNFGTLILYHDVTACLSGLMLTSIIVKCLPEHSNNLINSLFYVTPKCKLSPKPKA